jgi:hypothetical protein
MKLVTNEHTGNEDLHIQGIIENIGEEIHEAKNDKKTPYVWVAVKVVYPDGIEDTVDALLWQASFEKHTDKFAVDKAVTLICNLETGSAQVQLPTARRVNIRKYNLATVAETVAVEA